MSTFCSYAGALGAEHNAAIYATAVGGRDGFQESRVVRRGVDRRVRASTVLYADRLTGVVGVVRDAVLARLEQARRVLDIPEFDVGTVEFQLTSHNDGEFFGPHTDAASPDTATRMLTFVYYVHREPKGYTGGELVFHSPDGKDELFKPENDTLVLFDPRISHEVRPISCSSGTFEDGRFTLNGWVHRRTAPRSSSAFFDQKIFTPVRQWSRRGAGMGAAPPSRPRTEDAQHLRDLLLLYGDLHRTGSSPRTVDVRPALGADTFFDEYYARNRPVMIPGGIADCRAVRDWSPEFLAERYGDVRIEITSGRDAMPDYERRYRETIEVVTLAELSRRLAAAGETNDFYVVARNNVLDRSELRTLRDTLTTPPGIIDDTDRRAGATKLWIGPQGTVTPMHFDEHSILFAQVHGRKHFKLAPSFDHPRMYAHHTWYSAVDPEAVDLHQYPLFADVSLMDVVLGPGDCLFLPVGWWHWAKSLSVSISATFSSFDRPWRNTALGRGSINRHEARSR